MYISYFADVRTVKKMGDGVPLPTASRCTSREPTSSGCQEIDVRITIVHVHDHGVPDRFTVADILCLAIFQTRGRGYDDVKRQNNPNPNFEVCDVQYVPA